MCGFKRTVVRSITASAVMKTDRNKKFEVIVDGKQAGALEKWKHIALTINSIWEAGGDGEKFEVLAAIRKTYNPETKADIRGSQRQTPAQIGRGEGFKELSYQRADPSSPAIVIVPPAMQYVRLVPQPAIEKNYVLVSKA